MLAGSVIRRMVVSPASPRSRRASSPADPRSTQSVPSHARIPRISVTSAGRRRNRGAGVSAPGHSRV